MGAYSEPRHDVGGIASRSHREQQRTAICTALSNRDVRGPKVRHKLCAPPPAMRSRRNPPAAAPRLRSGAHVGLFNARSYLAFLWSFLGCCLVAGCA